MFVSMNRVTLGSDNLFKAQDNYVRPAEIGHQYLIDKCPQE